MADKNSGATDTHDGEVDTANQSLEDTTTTTDASADTDAQPPAGGSDSHADDGNKSKTEESVPYAQFKRAQEEKNRLLKKQGELAARLKQYEEAEQATKAKEQSELDKIKGELQKNADMLKKLQQERDEALLGYEVEKSARSFKYQDPQDALALIRSEIEYDDDGKPTNIDELLRDLAKRKPYLIEAQRPTASAGGPANPPKKEGGNSSPKLTKEAIKGMSAKEINARWAEISQILKEG